jgi:ParB family chromosome partitioning protein
MQKKVLGRGLSALMPQKQTKPGTRIVNLEISEINFSQFQPRQEINPLKLEELIASIKEKGVIQPVIVRTIENGYELIAGERRLRAARKLGFTQLPAIIRDVDDSEVLQLALIENIQREELSALEEAMAYQQLISEFGFTQEKIARVVGKDASSISNTLRLLKLPEEIQTALRKGMITMGHARTMLAVKGLGEQDSLFKRTITQRLSVRELENLVTRKKGGIRQKRQSKEDPHLVSLSEQLQQVLGTKVKIVSGRKRGNIIIEYYSPNDLERIINLFKTIK